MEKNAKFAKTNLNENLNYMCKKRFSLLVAMMLFCVVSAFAQVSQRIGVPQSVDKWIVTTFAKGKTPPFTFDYDGVGSQTFIRKWRHTLECVSKTEDVVEYVATYSDKATGLKVECCIKGFPKFGAVEWVLNFENEGSVNTPQRSHFLPGVRPGVVHPAETPSTGTS